MENANKKYHFLKFLYFIRFFGDCLFYSFYQMYLFSIGLNESQIGVLCAITPIVTIICNPIYNLLTTDVRKNKLIMQIITVIEGVAIIIYGNLDTYEILIGLMIILAIAACPFYSLLDGYSGTFSAENNKSYPRIRMMGTLAYIVGNIVGGFFITEIGFKFTFLIAGSIFVFVSLLIFMLKDKKEKCEEEKDALVKEKKTRNFKAVFKNGYLYIYLIFYVFTVAIGAVGDNFFSIYLKKIRDVSESGYGYIQALVIGVEFLTILLLSLKDNHNNKVLLIISGTFYFLRFLLIGLNLPLPLTIMAASFRGISWGIILAISVKEVTNILGLENLTTGILIVALATAIVTALGNVISGKLLCSFSYESVYLALSFIALTSTIFYIFVNLAFKNKFKKNNI